MHFLFLFFTLFISLVFSLVSQGFAAEVDHFTHREDELQDSSFIINHLANKKIRSSLNFLNQSQHQCEEKRLYDELRTIFANHTNGELTISIIENSFIPKRVIGFKESIFSEWSLWDGFVLGSPFFKKSGLTISPLVRIGDEVVGTDKFEHMFGRGFQYFKNYYLKQKDVKDAIKRGIMDEKLIFGGNKVATGVFSYGDLAANFNGMRFWNHMLQLREDVIGQNLGPYITCTKGRFELIKELDFRNYMDASMDESINCSKFPTEKTLSRFKHQLQKRALTCPVDQDALAKMQLKYGAFSRWIINPKGNMKLDYTGEFEERKK